MRQFHYCIVLLVQIFFVLWKNRYTIKNVVLQRKQLVFVMKVPVKAFSIINLV